MGDPTRHDVSQFQWIPTDVNGDIDHRIFRGTHRRGHFGRSSFQLNQFVAKSFELRLYFVRVLGLQLC